MMGVEEESESASEVEVPESTDPCNGIGKRMSEDVDNIIGVARSLGAISLDISKKRLQYIPSAVLELDHVEYLYLEGNEIKEIPGELFERLPNLRWLDLRSNCLQSLPATIGGHRCLRTLLLEDNQIKELPAELGCVKTLDGLNLHNNPLVFPPGRIIEKGVKEILRYLKDAIQIKDKRILSAEYMVEDLQLSDSSGTRASSDSEGEFLPSDHQNKIYRSGGKDLIRSNQNINDEDLEFPRPTSVSLHRHLSYDEYKQLQYEKFKRAGALGVMSAKQRKKKKKEQKLRSPRTIDPIESRHAEEQKLAKLKELKEKQDAIEQKRKDLQLLDDWRAETKELQRKHYVRAVRNAQVQDFTDPVKMPYDTDPAYMKVMSKEERIKQEVKQKHETMKNRSNPENRKMMEQARIQRDRQLMQKIKDHQAKVSERKKQPRGNPREEMEAAKRDLEMLPTLGEFSNVRIW
ncbi:uncharacterized protein [Amphiura filiformis]|uniref:uncharacterized protein isoform X2 n=1 Tax=Amphiura filiformis TaxID=82378 RepID=UPI003B226037